MHKARAAVGTPPSAPLSGITELFDKPLLLWGEKPVCRGSCKSSPESENRACTHSRLMQLRKKRNKSKKEPVWRPSTGASGLLKMTAWRIEVAPFPDLSNVYAPQYLSSPSQSLYMDMGMVMMPKKGVPRGGVMGGSIGSTSATKPVAVAVWFGL